MNQNERRGINKIICRSMTNLLCKGMARLEVDFPLNYKEKKELIEKLVKGAIR